MQSRSGTPSEKGPTEDARRSLHLGHRTIRRDDQRRATRFDERVSRSRGLSFSDVSRLIREACDLAGLHVLQAHPSRSTGGFRQRWRAAFTGLEVDWRGVRYDWERLGTELAPACERRRALHEYDGRRLEPDTALVAPSLGGADEVYEVRGELPNHAWWRTHIGASDLYIVHGEWLWSFTMTHEEEGLGIGPFFVERLVASD